MSKTLLTRKETSQIIEGILDPFLHNADLVKAMFVPLRLPANDVSLATPDTRNNNNGGGGGGSAGVEQDGKPLDSTDGANVSCVPVTSGESIGRQHHGKRDGQDTRGGGQWSAPPADVTTTTTTAGGVSASAGGGFGAGAGGGSCSPWGYRTSLAPRGCWKVDAGMVARRDDSVELGFDSVAFEIFLDLGHQRLER